MSSAARRIDSSPVASRNLEPRPNRHAQAVRLLADPETYTTALVTIVLDRYGTEALEWSPETLFMELKDDFGVDLPQENKDQLLVGISLLTSDDFYRRLPRFVQMCNTLSGSPLDEKFDFANAVECAWGVTEAFLLSPPDEETEFDPEILHYLGVVLDEAGILKPPGPLGIALRGNFTGLSPLEALPETDPDMFAAAYKSKLAASEEIEQQLIAGIARLLDQLSALTGRKLDASVIADMFSN